MKPFNPRDTLHQNRAIRGWVGGLGQSKWSIGLLRTQPQGTAEEPVLRSVFDGDILRGPADTRGWCNSADGVDPVDLVRDVATDFAEVQPWNVLGWVGVWGIRQRLADKHSVIDSLELRSRTEVPDGRNPSCSIADEIMLREDQTRGDHIGEGSDELLDRDIAGSRAVPEVEQVLVDARYELAVGGCKAGYIKKLSNSAGGNKHVVSRTSIVLDTKTEPHGSEGGSGKSEGSLLSRRKRDGDVGKIVDSRLFNWPRER